MATIVYLDVEDEITTAASRIRTAAGTRVGMVIPFGSRVATSRINFRLLAREAFDTGRRLDIIAPDGSARALAASAGLPVFASVGEYEAALEAGEAAAAAPAAAAGGAQRGGMATAPVGTVPAAEEAADRGDGRPRAGANRPAAEREPREPHARPATEAAAIAAQGRSAAATGHSRDATEEPHRRGRRGGLIILVLALALVLGFGGAAAALALPTADITVTPSYETVGPVSVTVRADTTATAVDPTALVIPATAVTVPVTAQEDFPATGTNIVQTAATGQVTFDSINTVNAMPVPRGTRVATSDGTTFSTTAAVTVPRATVPGGGSTITHGRATVGVVAVAAGPKGNVAAGAIDQVPSSFAALQVSVSNAAPTTGGTKSETPKITPDDVTAATTKLSKDLADQASTAVADPSLTPQGMHLFPDTAKLGDPTYTPDVAGLAGKVLKAGQTSFTLQANATATVIAVDESSLKSIGETAVRAAVTAPKQLVDGSVQVTVGDGTVGEDGTVSYAVTATALARRPLDAASLKAQILGKTPPEAGAILAQAGRVDVSLWPFWVTAVPDNPDHVHLTIAAPAAPPATPTPSVSPSPSPTPRPTKSPSTPKPSASAASTVPSVSPVPSS